MSTETITLHGDYVTDDYYTYYHVRETDHGVYRAAVEHENYADEPTFDYGSPIVQIEHSGWGSARFSMTGYGEGSERGDGLDDDLAGILQRVYDGGYHGYGSDNAGCGDVDGALEVVNRWLKTYHGGSLIRFTSTVHRGGYDYVAYDTRAMREVRYGDDSQMVETSNPDSGEWQAYIDGEVYAVRVEQASFDDEGEIEDWHEVGEGWVHGHYGDDWAAQAGVDELDATIAWRARSMLPLGA